MQPLLSKSILPWFGGSPAVWTACVLFFQTMLCAGYAYAHVLEHCLQPRFQKIGHLALIVAALATLPIIPSDNWQPVNEGGRAAEAPGTLSPGLVDAFQPTGRILALLTFCVGLPYFVLASTGPLVQAWFSRTFPDRSPYRLYAISNAGSLLALLSYPFLLEPALAVDSQATWWSAGFVLFCLLYASASLRAGHYQGDVPGSTPPTERSPSDPSPSWIRRLLWVVLPAFASMMLLAATNHACQDVAVIPFLWVVPLSLYLISFIITFDHPRWYRRLPWGLAAIAAVYVVVGMENIAAWRVLRALYELTMWATGQQVQPWNVSVGYQGELTALFAALFFLCLICHGELFRLRPSPRYLTSYYFLISLGGALGGLLVSLVAPMIFVTYFEWRICLLGGCLLAAMVVFGGAWLRPRG